MKNLTKFALRRPVTLILALVTILFFGLQSVISSPMELTPDMELPMMIVTTTYSGANPDDIYQLVSKPIEDGVSSLSGLDTVSSRSMENISMVIVKYDYGTNMDTAYLNLKKALDNIVGSLPDDAGTPSIFEIDINAMPVMQIAISGGTDGSLYDYVDQKIVPEFDKLASVGDVSISGGQSDYIKISLNPDKMQQYGLDMSSVAQLVSAADFAIPSGTTSFGNQDISVSVGASYKDLDKIKSIVLPVKGGIVHLSDVADVYNATKEISSISRYDGQDVVMASIQKQQSYSAVDVSKAVSAEIDNMKLENPSLKADIIYNSSDTIINSIKGVFQTLLLAIILSMIVLFLFFGDIKASLIVGSSIPISVMISLVAMGAMGFSLNLISIGSLVLGVGMIVDNSIVVIESCFRNKTKGNDFYDAAISGTHMVLASITGSTATTCVVFLPLALLQGLSGQLFKQLGFTIVFCMIASLFSASMIVPLLYFFLHPREREEAIIGRFMQGLQDRYRRVVSKILPHKFSVVTIAVVLLIASFFMASRLGVELMTSVDQGIITVTVDTKPGLKIAAVDDVLTKVESVVAADTDVEKYQVSAGSSGISSLGIDSGSTVTAYLKKSRVMKTDDIITKWKSEMGSITDSTVTLENTSSSGPSSMSTSDIEVDLQSTDYDLLKSTADGIVEKLRTQNYVTKVHSSTENAAPVLKVDIDPVKAQAVGLIPSSIGSGLYMALSGKEANNYTVNGKEYTVRVEYPDDKYDSVDKIENYIIKTATGTSVPLSSIASVKFEDSPKTISRSNKQFQVAITAEPVNGYEDTASTSMKKYINEQQFPSGVEYAPSSADKMMQDELGALGQAILTAIFLIFIVMAIQFESPKFSLMVMFTIPFSLIGAFGLLFIANSKISMVSMIGFLMMIGTVVNNGILYVDTANQLRSTMTLDEALVEAGAIRIRPILMTTITTIIAMIPLCLGYGESGEMLQGLALVNVGGLVAATILSLLLLPTFYKMIDGIGKKLVYDDTELLDVD